MAHIRHLKTKLNWLILITFMVCAIASTGCEYQPSSKAVSEDQVKILRAVIAQNGTTAVYGDVLSGKSSGYKISIPFDWSCEPYLSDPSFCFRMHGFTFLDNAYYQWTTTGDVKYKTAIIEWINDWVRANPTIDMSNEWGWNDDSVARRVFRMSVYSHQWSDDFSEAQMNAIKKSLRMQADLLSQEDFYTEKHNHGMFQDIGLVAYALLHGSDRERDTYLELAKVRSGEYFDYSFTSEGVHKEHSPDYHMWVAKSGVAFYRDIYKNVDEQFSDKMSRLFGSTALFYTQLVMPDGTVPSIGDSARRVASSGIYDTPEYAWASSQGVTGTAPSDVAVFPNSGYAIMRSSWKDSAERATYLLFMAATHSSAHKHGDDLNFLLYHGGDLFTEAGNKDYTYTDEMTAYTYSGYAHNVLTVGGEAFPVEVGNSGFQAVLSDAYRTKITGFGTDPIGPWVSGMQYRFQGVEHTRRLSYNTNDGIVQVSDVIHSDHPEPASLIYHVAEKVKAERTSKGWKLYRGNKVVARISLSSDAELNLETVEGMGSKPYYSALYQGSKEPKEATVLKVNFDLIEGDTSVEMNIELMPL